MPILLPIGWKSSTLSSLIYRHRAPIIVSGGGSSGSLPRSRSATACAASIPLAADSIYPSTPVICPAKLTLGSFFSLNQPSSSRGESRKVLRCITPYRTNSAFSSPGIIEKTRFCSGNSRLVWNPTILYMVPAAFSRRSWILAHGRCPVRGSRSPTGRSGPYRMVSRPRFASTSMGIQPSYTLKYSFSNSCSSTLFAFTSAS